MTTAAVQMVSLRRMTFATAANVLARLAGMILGVLGAAFLTRSLGVRGFGQLSVALALVGVAGSAGDLGLTQVAVRDMAAEPERRPEILGALVVARSLLAVGLTAGVTGALMAMLPPGGTRWMALFVGLTIPLGALGAITAGAQSRLRPELMSYISLAQSIVWVSLIVLLSSVTHAVSLYGAAFLFAAAVQTALALWVCRNISDVMWTSTWRTLRPLLVAALPLGLAGLCVTAYYKVDGIILFEMKGAEQAALYAGAYRFLDVLQLFPIAVLAMLLPLLSSLRRRKSADAAASAVQAALVLLVLIAAPIVVGGALLSRRIVELVYGPDFAASAQLLTILLPTFLSICLGYVFTGLVLSGGSLWPYAVVAGVAAILNVAGNVVVIPEFGATGAAWLTLVTEFSVMTAVAAIARRRVAVELPWERWLRTALATTAMAAAIVVLPQWLPLWLVLATATAVFASAAIVFGAVRRVDAQRLFSRDQGFTG